MDTGGELYSYSNELHAASDVLLLVFLFPLKHIMKKTTAERNQELYAAVANAPSFLPYTNAYTLSRRQPCLFGSSIP